MTKRSQRNASIEQLWESHSARAAGTALLGAPIALAKSILSIKNRQIKLYLDRTVRAEAKESQPPIELGTRQAKNKQGFKGWRDAEARAYLHLQRVSNSKNQHICVETKNLTRHPKLVENKLMAKERPPLEEMTLRQLRRVASECGVSRYSRMRKSQLLASIQEIQRTKFSYSPSRKLEAQEAVEAAKFELGQEDRTGGSLSSVDEGLADLPNGYGESRVVLMPRDPEWAYTYWDIPNDRKQEMRRQGGQQLALRIYDVTDVNLEIQSPHSIQEYPCDELAREWYVPIPVSDRDYAIDIGYRCADGRWLVLARSAQVRVPPVYPSDWIEDQFITLDWEEDLSGKTFAELVPPAKKMAQAATAAATYSNGNAIYEQIFGMAESAEAMRVAGSVFGSMQHVAGSVQQVGIHEQAISSYVFPSGVGMWAAPAMSGLTMSGVGMSGLTMSGAGMSGLTMSGAGMSGLTMSGIGMSGVGMSGVGFAAPMRPRQFWLVADAELIVYGATEPDATVYVGGQPIKLNADGTFRFQMSFQDGLIDYPIFAVAADGEQNRAVHMKFERETPERRTNTKEDAVVEWLG